MAYSSAKASITRGVGRMADLIVTRGQGSYVETSCGKRLLDFTTGIGVTNCGHSHPRIVEATQKQCSEIVHAQVNIAYHDKMLELTDLLIPSLPKGLDTIFYGTTGAEAVENALKMARAYTGKHATVVFRGGYHGRTFGTMSMTTSSRIYRQKFGPLLSGIHVAPFPYEYHGVTSDDAMDALEHLFKEVLHEEDVAAIVLEPVLGEGGYVPAPPDFLKRVKEFASKKDILFICDEVQTGFGRTGSLFACDSDRYGHDVMPDILTMAKGIASGFPISAVATRREISDAVEPGMLGGTYSGNAVACASAIATQKVIADENLVENSAKKGKKMMENLRQIQSQTNGLIGDVRGIGCMVGVEFTDSAPTGIKPLLSQHCLDNGMLLLGCSTFDVMRFIPPLNVSDEDIDKGCEIFEKSVKMSVP
eukprot:CAMPEP_0185730796 /NCGR_PEP_ID=MMETSP1171-20130828/11036_1 /TAXON_ID=374046 /ORGANISM="Helicotheca tamensis, Strain CCMP826" /LENGTH=419 /DNA_ID=CAMNT_0028399927 /DNA_START=32 /DNA_END=1291 /DNA_ORIENTATION=+